MKLVYILEQFYLHGGAEKIVSQKANWLVNNGFEVTIISNFQKNNPYIYSLNSKINFIDLNINYNRKKSYFHPVNLLKAPKHIYKLKKLLNKINPDIVIDLSLQFDYYALPFITKAKTIREFHSSRYNYEIKHLEANIIKNIIYRLNEFVEKRYDTLVVLTPDEVKHYKTNNIIVIPNGISIYTGNINLIKRDKIVLAAGRLAPVKNFEELIEIWKDVSKSFPDWQLHIYGGGDNNYLDKLQKIIKKYDLENNICLCGETVELLDKMRQASIYVMTSITECYPLVLLEAKSVGLPVISYDCPYGPRNIVINNEDGLLVENSNKDKFVKAIEKLINENTLHSRMSNNAVNNTRIFLQSIVMTKWVHLFNQLTN